MSIGTRLRHLREALTFPGTRIVMPSARTLTIAIALAIFVDVGMSAEIPNRQAVDLSSVPTDLVVPNLVEGDPAAGIRVRQTNAGYDNAAIYHALYLPTDWKPDETYPVLVEYAGNKTRTLPGTVESSNLGYGVSGGERFIWLCLPYLNGDGTANMTNWWGDPDTYQVQPTIDYCKRTVREVCQQYGGDPRNIVLCGFSRGSIACNYIGLHDDEIAGLWRAFICYSHYDGQREGWPYPHASREDALARLKRLQGRPQFICSEPTPTRNSTNLYLGLEGLKRYLESTGEQASWTFMYTGFRQHDDAWILRPSSTRQALRTWLDEVLQ